MALMETVYSIQAAKYANALRVAYVNTSYRMDVQQVTICRQKLTG